MKFIRSTLVVAVTALVAAACGDKVTVPAPVTNTTVITTAAPKVNSVTVTPSNATMNIGDVISMVAAVNADAGLATTVTWSSSDATKVSVDATGKVTALLATPGVAICAASTVDAGKKGCGQVSVNAAGVTIPATVRIVSITQGSLNTPVNNAAVAGAVNVSLSVAPGTQTISKIALTLNGTEVDNQTFTATQAAALRGAADQAVATQSTFPTIVFFVNTAALNTAGNAPQYLNGAYTIGANLYVKGSTAVAASATNATGVTFANVDGFGVSLVPNTTVAAGVTDATGYRWYGNGTLTANLVPIMYSGLSVGTVNVALAGACGAVGGAGSTGTSTTAPYAITLALTGSQSPAGCATTTPNIPIVTSVDANGNAMTLVANGTLNVTLGGVAASGIRWDNVAPAKPTLDISTGGTRAGSWVNAAVAFASRRPATGTSNAVVTNATPSTKASGIMGALAWTATYAAVGTATDGGVAGAVAGTAAPTAASVPNSLTAATYCLVVRATDLLGNLSTAPTKTSSASCTTPADGAVQFGADNIAPGIVADGSPAYTKSLRMFSTSAPAQMGYILSDTSINSASANVTVIGSAVRFGGTTAADTLLVNNLAAGQTVTPPTITQTTVASGIAAGYWTVTATASDQAGNSTSITPYVFLYDNTAAAASLAMQTDAGLTAGNAENFYATGTDNVDLDSAVVTYNMVDAASAVWPFTLSKTKVQASPFLVGSPVKSAAINGAWAVFPRGFNTVASTATILSGSATVNVPTGTAAVTFWTTDQTNGGTGTLATGNTATAMTGFTYSAVNLPAAAAWANSFTAATVKLVSARVNNGPFNQAAGSGKITTDTITVTVAATGVLTPPTSNPFSRAELWFRTNSGLSATSAAAPGSRGFEMLSTLTPVVTYDGQAQTATWTYTYIFTPGTAYKTGTAYYGFVGYDSKFNALVTPSAAVTLAP